MPRPVLISATSLVMMAENLVSARALVHAMGGECGGKISDMIPCGIRVGYTKILEFHASLVRHVYECRLSKFWPLEGTDFGPGLWLERPQTVRLVALLVRPKAVVRQPVQR